MGSKSKNYKSDLESDESAEELGLVNISHHDHSFNVLDPWAGCALTSSIIPFPDFVSVAENNTWYSTLSYVDSKASYKALSYTWGEVDENRGFWLSDNIVETLNAYPGDLEKLHLWFDAVCINQGNTNEKIDQVKRMRKIYTDAISVQVWIGNQGDDTVNPTQAIMYCLPCTIAPDISYWSTAVWRNARMNGSLQHTTDRLPVLKKRLLNLDEQAYKCSYAARKRYIPQADFNDEPAILKRMSDVAIRTLVNDILGDSFELKIDLGLTLKGHTYGKPASHMSRLLLSWQPSENIPSVWEERMKHILEVSKHSYDYLEDLLGLTYRFTKPGRFFLGSPNWYTNFPLHRSAWKFGWYGNEICSGCVQDAHSSKENCTPREEKQKFNKCPNENCMRDRHPYIDQKSIQPINTGTQELARSHFSMIIAPKLSRVWGKLSTAIRAVAWKNQSIYLMSLNSHKTQHYRCQRNTGNGLKSRLLVPLVMACLPAVSATPLERQSFLTQSAETIVAKTMYEQVISIGEILWPWESTSDISSTPERLIAACLICTFIIVLAITVRRRDAHQAHFLAGGVFVSTALSAAFRTSIEEFVFRFLFWGACASLFLSACWHHRTASNLQSTRNGTKKSSG